MLNNIVTVKSGLGIIIRLGTLAASERYVINAPVLKSLFRLSVCLSVCLYDALEL